MVAMNELTISEILRGMQPGRLQTVGIMQVLPLTGDPDLFDADLISPQDEMRKTSTGTTDYGSMEFDNPTDKVLLVPCHVGYVTKQAAQDHAMAHAGLVEKKKKRRFSTAMCIQENQGGYIAKDQHKMLILPYALRERALALREKKEYGKLWDDISTFNRDLGIRQSGRRGHLEFFLEKFKQELDQFVAEFERVPQQCGAIILINGQVVGVERAPSPHFWGDIWRPLVRECYGSLAIQVRQKTGPAAVPKTRVPLRGRVSSLDDLDRALSERSRKQDQKAREIIRKLLSEPFERTDEQKLLKYQITTVKNGQFTGQVVQDDSKISYASLFTVKEWAKSAPWRQASEFAV